jgi:hypothetical protein
LTLDVNQTTEFIEEVFRSAPMSISADWSNCHAILKKGLAAAAEAERPSPPFHLGGPVPVCPALTQVALAVWCAQALEPSLPAGARGDYQRVLGLAEAYLERPASERPTYELLSAASERTRAEPPALAAAG